jgi:hypothetical protein
MSNSDRNSIKALTQKSFIVILVLIFMLQILIPFPSTAREYQFKKSETQIFDFQSIDQNIAIYNNQIVYPRKIYKRFPDEIVYQTWSMNINGSNKKVLLHGSFARNIAFSDNDIFYSPTNPTLRRFSQGIRKTNLITNQTSCIFNEAISNFQLNDQMLFCLQKSSGFYLSCNCKSKETSIICQSSSYKKLFRHNQYCIVFEDTDYENNVSTNYKASILQLKTRKTQTLTDAGYNFFADNTFLYYIDIKDQKIYRTDFETFQDQPLCNIAATSFRMDEQYIYFINCEMGLLRPEYRYYRITQNGENLTYICSLPDHQLPLGIQEKSYHILGEFLYEIHDDGTKTKRIEIPNGGRVLLVTKDAVYYTHATESTGMNTDVDVLHLDP